MGSGIVSNLLKMGHTVTVWNRTAEKVSIKGEVCHLEGGVPEGYSVFLLSVPHLG